MQRFHQLIFIGSVLALSWLGMMAVHEFGHVFGAFVTGGEVNRVVLHPLAISRTDVSPNPSPLIVVWLGPVLGCLLPVVMWRLLPRSMVVAKNLAMFFAGFCLVANGAYIAIGSFDRVGDCSVMLQNGSPQWLLLAFGALSIPTGFYIWHRLGSAKDFLRDPSQVSTTTAYTLLCVLGILLAVECVASGW